MLLSFEINKWNDCHFQPVTCVQTDDIATLAGSQNTVIELHGSCFCGKTMIFQAIQYVKSIIVERKMKFQKADIKLTFFNNGNKYTYHVKTTSNIFYEKVEGASIREPVTDDQPKKESLISPNNFPEIYSWFENLNFIYPLYDVSQLTAKLLSNISEGLLNLYEKFIYPNSDCYTEMAYEPTLPNGYLTLSRHGKSFKLSIQDLSFSLKEFLFWLPTLNEFKNSSGNKVLIVDDVDMVANGLIKTVLQEECLSSMSLSCLKQLIVFSNKKDKNVFLRNQSKIIMLRPFI